MPVAVRAARAILLLAAGLVVVLFAVLLATGFTAGGMGAAVMTPLLFGVVGVVLAVLVGPGRRAVRVVLTVTVVAWAVISVGAAGRGDVTGLAGAVLAITVLVLINTRSARAYFRPARRTLQHRA